MSDIETVREFVQTGVIRDSERFKHGMDFRLCRIVCGPRGCVQPLHVLIATAALDRLEAELKGNREALVDIAKHSYPGEYPMDNAAKLNRIAYRARAALADQDGQGFAQGGKPGTLRDTAAPSGVGNCEATHLADQQEGGEEDA